MRPATLLYIGVKLIAICQSAYHIWPIEFTVKRRLQSLPLPCILCAAILSAIGPANKYPGAAWGDTRIQAGSKYRDRFRLNKTEGAAVQCYLLRGFRDSGPWALCGMFKRVEPVIGGTSRRHEHYLVLRRALQVSAGVQDTQLGKLPRVQV